MSAKKNSNQYNTMLNKMVSLGTTRKIILRGFITFEELNNMLPVEFCSSKQIDAVLNFLKRC